MVDVLVAGDGLADPSAAAVVAAQQPRDLGRDEQAVAADVRVARRAGARRVGQEPVLVAGDPRDASYSSQLAPPSGLRKSRAGSVPAISSVTKRNVEAVSPA